MAETGATPDAKDCYRCKTAIIWLWSPRIHDGLGGWVLFERVSEDGMTIRSHRCEPPKGPFDYQGSESAP